MVRMWMMVVRLMMMAVVVVVMVGVSVVVLVGVVCVCVFFVCSPHPTLKVTPEAS